jgi:hypothetical protein
MTRLCDSSAGCSYVVGVAGNTADTLSSYRIRGFRGHNKIKINEPIVKEVPVDRDES